MPKPYTFPTLYNEAFQLSISKMKEWEYLNPEQIKTGTITWSRNVYVFKQSLLSSVDSLLQYIFSPI